MTAPVTSRARVLDDAGNRKVILDALREGLNLSSAASLVGLSRKGLHDYRRDYPAFHEECIKAATEYEREMLRVVNVAAKDDDGAKHAQWLLERRFPTKWSTRSEVRQFTADDDDERDDTDDVPDDVLEKRARGE